MADVFDEVEEQLRSARYMDIARRAWPYALAALGAALLVALCVWGWNGYARGKDEAASRDYAAALTALGKKDMAGADTLFAKVAREGRGGYRALALMQEAGLRLQSAKPLEAVTLLDSAARANRDPVVADAAALEAALVSMDRAPLAQTQSRLDPLLKEGRPYRSMAREALAMARLGAGRPADARRDLQLLVLQQDVSENARARAKAALAMIDSGAASTVPAVVKAQAAAPAQPLVAPLSAAGQAQGGAQGGDQGPPGPPAQPAAQ